MEFKIIDVSTSDKELEVILAYDEVKDDINKEVQKQSKKIQMPGFRKGKVPVSMLKKMYGDALEYEAAEKVANSQKNHNKGCWPTKKTQEIQKPLFDCLAKDTGYVKQGQNKKTAQKQKANGNNLFNHFLVKSNFRTAFIFSFKKRQWPSTYILYQNK